MGLHKKEPAQKSLKTSDLKDSVGGVENIFQSKLTSSFTHRGSIIWCEKTSAQINKKWTFQLTFGQVYIYLQIHIINQFVL